jgi:hypothetical protein
MGMIPLFGALLESAFTNFDMTNSRGFVSVIATIPLSPT